MLAEIDTYINAAAQRLYEANMDPWVQDNCRAREEYLRTYGRINELTAEKAAWEIERAALQDENSALQDEVTALREKLAQYESQQ